MSVRGQESWKRRFFPPTLYGGELSCGSQEMSAANHYWCEMRARYIGSDLLEIAVTTSSKTQPPISPRERTATVIIVLDREQQDALLALLQARKDSAL